MKNDARWNEARFNAFIKGLLRAGMRRWNPKSIVKKEARLDRGIYRCAGHKKRWHKVPVTKVVNKKRINNIFIDHIDPVIDPDVGFQSWDVVIERMFCDSDNLQLLCKDCHDKKTAEEKVRSTQRRKAYGRKDNN
jgi:hypothetical protein